MRSRSTGATATRWPGALSVFPSSISRRCSRRSFSTTTGQGTSERVPRGLRCGQNADECEARDEGRSLGYDAEERDEAGAAFCCNPEGRGFSGGLLCREACQWAPPLASPRFAHPLPKSRRRNRAELVQRSPDAFLARYVPAFNASFLGLYGDATATAETAKEFKILYQKQPGPNPGGYTVDHSAGTYLFDPQGRLRVFESYGQGPDVFAHDIRALLQEPLT